MNSILRQTIEGRIAYADLINAPAQQFTCKFRGSNGVIHVGRKYLRNDEIYWGEIEENPASLRGSSKKNIKALAASRALGIDPDCPLPSVTPCIITDSSGKVYFYKAENGITRKKADTFNGYIDGLWYDVVSYEATEGRSAAYNRAVWLQLENDGLPQESHTVDDLVSCCSTLIAENNLDKEESAIRDFVYESAPNMSTQDKNEVVRIVLKSEDVPTVTINWRDNECWAWLKDKCLDDDVDVNYCFPYHYFEDRVYSVFKQFHETGNVQYLVQHFENRGDSDEFVIVARQKQKEKWELLRQIMKSVALYMVSNDWQLPVNKDQYFPQIKTGDYADDPNRIVFDS